MLVINPMVSDTRVEKEARALVENGFAVTVVAIHAEGLPVDEVRDGFRIVRLPYRRPLKDVFTSPFYRASVRHAGRVQALHAAERAGHRPWSVHVRLRGLVERGMTRAWLLVGGVLLKTMRSRSLTVEYWHGIGRRLPDLLERPDVITAHDLGPLQAAVRLAERWETPTSRPKVVYDSHELYVEQQTRWTRREKLAWKRHERKVIAQTDLVITVSTGIATELQRRYGLQQRPTVVLNSPRRRDLAVGDCETDLRADIDHQRGVLAVYVGGVKPGRGVDRLIPALAARNGWTLAVVGAPPSRYVQDLVAAAKELEVEDRFVLVDSRPADELPQYLRTADVGVHPMEPSCLNHELALPNKLFDYLFAGLPVAVSDLREMGSLVRDHGLGTTFDARSPVSTATAILEAATLRPPIVSTPLLDAWSWEHQAQQLVEAYFRLVDVDG